MALSPRARLPRQGLHASLHDALLAELGAVGSSSSDSAEDDFALLAGLVADPASSESSSDDSLSSSPLPERKRGRQAKENSARFRSKEADLIEALRQAVGAGPRARKPEVLALALQQIQDHKRHAAIPTPMASQPALNGTTPTMLINPSGMVIDANQAMKKIWSLPEATEALRSLRFSSLFRGKGVPNAERSLALSLQSWAEPSASSTDVISLPVYYRVKCPTILKNTKFSSERYALYFVFRAVPRSSCLSPSAQIDAVEVTVTPMPAELKLD